MNAIERRTVGSAIQRGLLGLTGYFDSHYIGTFLWPADRHPIADWAVYKRPTVTTKCPADAYHASGERIVEFCFPDGTGGLISFREQTFGGTTRPVVELYRLDPNLLVLVGPVSDEGRSSSIRAERRGVNGTLAVIDTGKG